MKLYMMKKSALETLKSNLAYIYSKYYIEATNDWMTEICGEDPFIEIAEVESFDLADLSLPKGQVEAENCKIIYSQLRKYVSPSQASDERLWAGLCNGTFYEYLRIRWDYIGEINGDVNTVVSNISARFFFAGGSARRSLFRNTLSKCWWIGRNLYDAEKKDHFWRIDALGYVDFFTKTYYIFASNNFSSNIEIVDGIIQALVHFKEQNIAIREREHLRTSLSFLNVVGGSIVLDGLTKAEIANLVINNIEKSLMGDNGALDFSEVESEDEPAEVE